jgi:hypothetical protein
MSIEVDRHVTKGVEELEPVRQKYALLSVIIFVAKWTLKLLILYCLLAIAKAFICQLNVDFATLKSNSSFSWLGIEVEKIFISYCNTIFISPPLPIQSLPNEISNLSVYSKEIANGIVYLCGYLVLSGFLGGQVSKHKANLRDKFDKWRSECVKLIHSDTTFSPHEFIDKNTFNDSCVTMSAYNRYWGSSLLRCGNTSASYLCVENERVEIYYETDSQGRSVQCQRTVIDNVFTGLLIVTPAKLKHPAWIILKPSGGSLPSGLSKMRVSSPALNRNYTIGATDEFAGHRLLTPSMMDNFMEFNKLFKYLSTFSYRGELLYVSIPSVMLTYGSYPSRAKPVTSSSLRAVADACKSSMQLVTESTKALLPT